MHPIPAKLFGFPSCIAHGMFSVCNMLHTEAISNKLYEREDTAVTVTASFVRPTILPATVEAWYDGSEEYAMGYTKGGEFKATVKGEVVVK